MEQCVICLPVAVLAMAGASLRMMCVLSWAARLSKALSQRVKVAADGEEEHGDGGALEQRGDGSALEQHGDGSALRDPPPSFSARLWWQQEND